MKVVTWIVYGSPLVIDNTDSTPYAGRDVIIKIGENATGREDFYGWRSDWGWIALQHDVAVFSK